MWIVSFLNLLLGGALGYIGAWVLRIRPPYRQMLVLSTTFSNVGALPYVLVPPLVINWRRTRDAPDANIIEGFGIIGMYALVWSISLLSLGQRYALTMREDSAQPPKPADPPPTEATEATGGMRALGRRALSLAQRVEPAIAMSFVGIGIGCIPPLKSVLGGSNGNEGALRFLGSGTYRVGRSGITVSTVILGGSLALGARARSQAARQRRREAEAEAQGQGQQQGGGDDEPAPAANGAVASGAVDVEAVRCADVDASTRSTFGALRASLSRRLRPQPRAPPLSKPADLTGGGGGGFFEPSVRRLPPRHADGGGVMVRLTIAAIVIKLMIVPAIVLPLVHLAVRGGALPDDPLIQMVLMLEAGTPSAQTALALVVAAGMPQRAQELSLVYLPQYAVSVISMAIVIVAAVGLIGDDP